MNTPSNSADDSYWTIPRPDWAQWERTRRAKLWQAVALLCELDPTRLEIGGQLNTVFIHTPPKFNSLLGLAKTGIGAGLLKLDKLEPENLEESEVDLTVFASWANTRGLPFPEGFPWKPEMNLDTSSWPWGGYENESLRKLAQAADRFWKNYDPADHSTAPTNDQVSTWLIEQKVTPRIAKAIASILRADGLPTGRRSK
ncbi:MAG: hypothetical protein ROZ09_00150 [Thiobacillus sp.]|uniref:hypothetical protein n=1 Tax=Thiobacillus sp. TaxID=924 RepID=UPI00289547B1|nr:hypothetical protein [Thiobacillus sp.]MDT3705205.1 hypothetical protein [Thiobacillus sp.]